MRPISVHRLNGGVTPAATAWARKPPKRPIDSTIAMAHRPSPSKGRSARAIGCSVMHAELAVHAQGPQREIGGVQVVLEVEHPREAGPVPEWILPAAVGPLRAQQVLDAGLHGRARR